MSEKIISSNYPSIKHLPFSKMRDKKDQWLSEREVKWMTEKVHAPGDVVIVTEKVDGCNVGVLRRGDELIPIMRRGYDVRTNEHEWIRLLAEFVEARKDRFMSLLADGERVCGEWMIKTHTVSYKMKHEPFICFDIINGTNRILYFDARKRLTDCGFMCAGLVHYGAAIPTEAAVKMLGDGFHGAIGAPEGVVYRYESVKDGWRYNAKFVSNPLVGNQEVFRENMGGGLMNKWRW